MNRLSIYAALVALGCGQPTRRTESHPTPSNVQPLVYDAHEWGLVDVYPRGIDITAGSPRFQQGRPEMMVEDKPVVYFHYRSGDRSQSINMVAQIPGGSLREVWPSANQVRDQDEVTLATPLSGDFSFTLLAAGNCPIAPSVGELCRTEPALDRYCERAELPNYQTSDADCLQVGRLAVPFLFYRGATPGAARLPIEVSRLVAGTTGEVHYSLNRVEPLEVQRGYLVNYNVAMDGDGRAALADTLQDRRSAADVVTDRPVRPPVTVQVPAVFPQTLDRTGMMRTEAPEDAESVARMMREDMLAVGLTSAEADAFMRAWRAELLEGRLADGQGMRGQVLLFWLPQSRINDIASLRFEPTPQRLNRAMMVRVHL